MELAVTSWFWYWSAFWKPCSYLLFNYEISTSQKEFAVFIYVCNHFIEAHNAYGEWCWQSHHPVAEHQKQHGVHLSCIRAPLFLPEFQVPRKTRFHHHQATRSPWTLPKANPLNPPARLRSLRCSRPPALPGSPREKVASPPPHQPQCSAEPLHLHAHQGFHLALLAFPSDARRLQKKSSHTQPCWCVV